LLLFLGWYKRSVIDREHKNQSHSFKAMFFFECNVIIILELKKKNNIVNIVFRNKINLHFIIRYTQAIYWFLRGHFNIKRYKEYCCCILWEHTRAWRITDLALEWNYSFGSNGHWVLIFCVPLFCLFVLVEWGTLFAG